MGQLMPKIIKFNVNFNHIYEKKVTLLVEVPTDVSQYPMPITIVINLGIKPPRSFCNDDNLST